MVKKLPWSVRACAYEHLLAGEDTGRSAAAAGVSRQAVSHWAKLAGMELISGPGGGVRLPMASEGLSRDKERRYRRLTLEDRAYIKACLGLPEPRSMRQIAKELGVHPSTVSREIRRHSIEHWARRYYDAGVAQHRALVRRRRNRPVKLSAGTAVWKEVVARLNQRFSPQQSAADLKKTFPEQPEMHVSHESIYQALYVQGRGALRHELAVEKALRSGRTGRKPPSKLPARNVRPWLEGARLSDRPAEVQDRAVPGHWEGDLVVGPGNSGIVTLVERSSRFTLLGRLPGARDSATVIEVMQKMIHTLPQAILKTITWDQGTEMAQHAKFTVATGCQLFFCDPHSPWQRGTNENTNGLVRDIHPKGTNFNQVSDEELAHTQHLLNIRPRQTLQWDTPTERLTKLIDGVALAS